MRVLITYATAHGSTKGVATEIGGRLAASGLSVDVLPAEGVGSLDGYDAVVIGSAVHNGAWLPPASSLIDHHVDELASRPVWLFSVSSVGESSSFFGARVAAVMRRMRGEPRQVTTLRRSIGARAHRVFAGAIEPSHWGRAGNLFLEVLGGTYGDHRDWLDIDAWAAEIAWQLLAVDRPASP